MRNKIKPPHWHYWVTLLLAVALGPALLRLHLPLRFDWITVVIAYWLILAAQSVFVAAILALVMWLTMTLPVYRRRATA